MVCASGLAALRWFLAEKAAAQSAKVQNLEAALSRFGEFERRLESLEVRLNTSTRRTP
jgi:hypothetical protein